MPLFFLGTREWRNRQTRTVQVRVPVMEWGFNSPLAHDETADPSRICGFCFPWLRPWRCWCSGRRRPRPLCVPVGGGPPASRPRCELRSARRLEAGQASLPPTGTAARPSGALHTGGAWLLMCYWVRCFEARPGPAPRRVPYPQFRMQFPDTCSSSLSEKPGISTITFQSMNCMWGNCMRICADQAPPPLTGTAAWSLYSLGASRGARVLSFWGAQVRVVTNVVNPRCFSCGFLPRCYERRQSEGFFADNGGFGAWIDDVCNRGSREVIGIALV